ncbi:uncharacterized protein LOC126884839 [Diabrotica virgifera virgifera]|uniref:Uncharacterized protein n=1 Tax=Diabrotica virgifera virgifera TaxID=50390 RepID=A0ABM5KA61_DIAVI|nr:uncharacterized protein LOC126884839 [Diabrotica virgifera virgifera]
MTKLEVPDCWNAILPLLGHVYNKCQGHHYSKKKKSRSIAMTALTLLAFLFFLHILQQCLHDQVETTTVAPTTIVMQANIQTAKEGAHNLAKDSGHSYNRDSMKESQIRAASDEIEVTTSYSSEERKMLQESSKEGGSFYQYDKVHVPVKMKMVERPHKIKRL